jgi:hypothetical protein
MYLVHPTLGVLTLLATFFLASRGLVARQGVVSSSDARRLHKRLGPWVLGAMWVTLAGGFGSTLLLRPDLTVGETWHTAVGLFTVGAMTTGWLTTRAFVRGTWVRSVHLAIGIVVLLAGILQGLLGIELLP